MSNGENLLALLNRHDANPDSVGKQLGIPEEVVKQWCDGNGVPDTRHAIKIAEMLQCDLHELYLAILRTPSKSGGEMQVQKGGGGMPKLRQYADKYAAEDFRKEMRIRQGEQDLMSKSALAEAANLPRTTVTKRLAEPETMTFGEFRKLNEAVHPDPVAVLPLLGYTMKDIKKLLAMLGYTLVKAQPERESA